MPKKSQIVKSTQTFVCANGKTAIFHHEGWQREANWWITTSETVENPCSSEWVVVGTTYAYFTETSCCGTVSYAPGARYYAENPQGVDGHVTNGLNASLESSPPCDPSYDGGTLYDAQGHTTPEPPCPGN